MPGATMGMTTKEVTTHFKITSSGREQTKLVTKELENLRGATATYGTTVQHAGKQTDTYVQSIKTTAPNMQQMTAHMQAMNMSILGLNMSLLGFSFALMSSGIATKEQTQALMRIIGPLQMTMSLMNLAGSLAQIYQLNKQRAAMADTIATELMVRNNNRLALSLKYLSTQMNMLWMTMGAAGLIMTGLLSTSRALRVVVWGLAGALAALAVKNMILAATRILNLSLMGPKGWIMLGIGLSLAGIGIGAAIAMMAPAKAISFFKGGIIPQTAVTYGDLGPEAIIPLDSERGRSSLRDALGGGSGKVIVNNYITADRPMIMYRKMNTAMRIKRYLTA